MLSVRTFGGGYDTLLSAYTGTCNPIDNALTEVACNDDVGDRLDSEILLPVTRGTRYLVMVSDGSGNIPWGGNLRIHFDLL
jgi:hypothetical protein